MTLTVGRRRLITGASALVAYGTLERSAAAFVPTTLNPNDKASAVTLSNGNLSMSIGGEVTFSGARTSASISSGKTYFEMTISAIPQQANVGIANSSLTLSGGNPDSSGTNVNCATFNQNGSFYYNSNSASGTAAAMSTSSAMCFAFDLNAKLAWMRVGSGNWNNSGTANPTTGTGGFSFSSFSGPFYVVGVLNTGYYGSQVMTFNFGATAFAQSVPTGFVGGFPPLSNNGAPVEVND